MQTGKQAIVSGRSPLAINDAIETVMARECD